MSPINIIILVLFRVPFASFWYVIAGESIPFSLFITWKPVPLPWIQSLFHFYHLESSPVPGNSFPFDSLLICDFRGIHSLFPLYHLEFSPLAGNPVPFPFLSLRNQSLDRESSPFPLFIWFPFLKTDKGIWFPSPWILVLGSPFPVPLHCHERHDRHLSSHNKTQL